MANKANDDSRCRRRLILYGSDNICGGGGCANDNAAVVGDGDDCDREFRIVRRWEFDLDDRAGWKWNAAAAMDGGRCVNARIVVAATTHHHHDVRVLERRRRRHFDSATAASAIGVDVVNMTTPRRRLPHSRPLLLFEDEHNIGVFAMSPSTP